MARNDVLAAVSYQHTGTPFDWKFTRTDLTSLLAASTATNPKLKLAA